MWKARRCGDRPPLRSVENAEQNLSPSSLRHKSKSLFNATKKDVSLILHSPASANITHPTGATTEMTSCMLGDVTFKSFICSGGEVELVQSSWCVGGDDENSIGLHQDQQTVSYTCEKDDTIASELVSSCGDHTEHPYCRPANADVGDDVAVAWKPFACDGGEVEVLNATASVLDASIPLPAGDLVQDNSIDSSNIFDSSQLGPAAEHVDHPYCNHVGGAKPGVVCDMTFKTMCTGAEAEIPNATKTSEATLPLPGDDIPTSTEPVITQDQLCVNHLEHLHCHLDHDDPVSCGEENCSLDPLNSEACGQATMRIPGVFTQLLQTNKEHLAQDPIQKSSCQDLDFFRTTRAFNKTMTIDPVCLEMPEKLLSHRDGSPLSDLGTLGSLEVFATPSEVSEAKDSTLGSSENQPPLPNCADKRLGETLPDVLKVLSECPSVASVALQLISPARRASLSLLMAHRDSADDSALEKTVVAQDSPHLAGLWADPLESPMPRPLFNSTTLCSKFHHGTVLEPNEDFSRKPCVVPQSGVQVSDLPGGPIIPEGPLQQQLQQMAEFLILVSGKVGLTAPPSAAAPPPLPPSVKSRSACVGSSPVKMLDQGLNTSGQFERKRNFSSADACSLTDPLLWNYPVFWSSGGQKQHRSHFYNVPPGSLECLPREELEQRLRSSMVMVEALVQQLAVARAHGRPSMGPLPSELRDKLVQTDHTELSQTTMYRDLYMEALNRIGHLEQDGASLNELIQYMQDMRVTMMSTASDTDAALSNMKHMEELVRQDHSSLVAHYEEMKFLCIKSKEMQSRMMQKVKDELQQRDQMRTQMDKAFTAKEAAFRTVEQLRSHCANEMASLQRSIGSQQELLAALNATFPEQVALNASNTETLNSASDLLCQTIQEQSSLMKELHDVRNLVHRTAPVLMTLKEKAADALGERDEHMSARDRALEDKEQLEEELRQAQLNLQAAGEQIADLNLQVTILTSEMGVLRQKLTECDDERGQLERKVTEMSATVSSTMAAHTFLEHALAEETSKLLQAQSDTSHAQNRADQFETSLYQAEQRVQELGQTLSEREEELRSLQVLLQSQSLEIQQMQDVRAQLDAEKEMNEFLLMENGLAREHIAESENMLRSNLQALRERNFQCEDLKTELSQLQLERRSVQDELEAVRARASTVQLKQGEELARAVTEITLLHHTLRGVTNQLHNALEKPDANNPQPAVKVERRHPSTSFVDCVMVALTAGKDEEAPTTTLVKPVPTDSPQSQTQAVFREKSAFTRVGITLKQNKEFEPEPEEDPGEEEQQSNALELLAHLSNTITELVTTLEAVQQHKDARAEELQSNICNLEMALQFANSQHESEMFEVKDQLNRMTTLMERGNQALQQKAEDEKMIIKLMAEINEAQELMTKLKSDYNELRKEAVELRRSLQQTQTEAQLLRTELRKAGGQTASDAHFMDEKLHLLKEVDRLKATLQEVEQARGKLLEKAKRHQMIHQMNQQKSEKELHMLNNMINKVRETLLCLPDVVKNCEHLQHLLEYLG
ncbi:sperm-associated antigen 5 isoform X2 [Dunckerocampus dactyliophorus]|uniref:sperm-associated antigen 5 isoform X2 n=1 Tax=Dunckerocampus dactyliophorus TaxID=161453 RepID=UPI002406521C|nr:sperm-associated antigen 5 isoform X2 [Dunckerocampus dactyliophorus]